MSRAHREASVAGRHAIHALSEFSDVAARDAHTYIAADVGKVVRVGSADPYRFYLIVGVSGSVATFRELTASALEYVGTFAVTGSAVQDLDITGLDGDSDNTYLIEFFIIKSSSLIAYSLHPNSADPTTAARTQGFSNGSAFTQDNELHITNTTDVRMQGRWEVLAASGKPRVFYQSYIRHADAADISAMERIDSTGVWLDTATNLTSLRVHSNDASGFQPGSFAIVWRRKTGA